MIILSIRTTLNRVSAPATGLGKEQPRATSWRELRDEASPAERAGGVGEEPGVNAPEMEGMAAFREQPELVLRLELAQAHGAVKRVLNADDGLVEEEGKRVDESLVDAGVVEVEQLPQLALHGGGAGYLFWVGGGWPEQASGEEVEQAGDEEDDCDDDDDEEDAGVNVGLLVYGCKNCCCWWRWWGWWRCWIRVS